MGTDILISSIIAWAISQQHDLICATKEVGIQHVVLYDFGTPGVKGVHALHNEKLEIHDFIKNLGVPYTFIDPIKDIMWRVYGDGLVCNLIMNNKNIGTYITQILMDPQMLNQAVVIWEDEMREWVSGKGDVLKAKQIAMGKDDYYSAVAAVKLLFDQDPITNASAQMPQTWNKYQISMLMLEENTLENAKKLGYLDAKELYPDITPLLLEEFAKRFYAMEDPGVVFSQED